MRKMIVLLSALAVTGTCLPSLAAPSATKASIMAQLDAGTRVSRNSLPTIIQANMLQAQLGAASLPALPRASVGSPDDQQLQDMRQLAINAANGTVTAQDRSDIHAEVAALHSDAPIQITTPRIDLNVPDIQLVAQPPAAIANLPVPGTQNGMSAAEKADGLGWGASPDPEDPDPVLVDRPARDPEAEFQAKQAATLGAAFPKMSM